MNPDDARYREEERVGLVALCSEVVDGSGLGTREDLRAYGVADSARPGGPRGLRFLCRGGAVAAECEVFGAPEGSIRKLDIGCYCRRHGIRSDVAGDRLGGAPLAPEHSS
jgi:hypothetical protein